MAKAPAAPEPAPRPSAPAAPESQRFQSPPALPDGVTIPDKFMRDGKPDLAAFVTSYGELEARQTKKYEDLRAELEAEQLKNRPESADKYELPKIEGVDAEEMAAHPLVAWWRESAHASGLPQDKFAEGVQKYVEALKPAEPDMEAVKTALGDNWQARLAAVDAWAGKTAKNDGELEALKSIAVNADGVKLLERLAGIGSPLEPDGRGAPPEPELTLEKLRAMQQDPRYWDTSRRDPAFVRQVAEGYAKLYPDAKRTA